MSRYRATIVESGVTPDDKQERVSSSNSATRDCITASHRAKARRVGDVSKTVDDPLCCVLPAHEGLVRPDVGPLAVAAAVGDADLVEILLDGG